ncbi:MAG: 30S ribosomal protein S8 [Acidobacteria bacterium]|nr:MAG: 30S ribosomal protein S8 [Acidobacteriota bacterium]
MSAITDPIADMLTRIRNGIRARHQRVEMPSSRLKVEVARVLKEEGFISNFKLGEEGKKKALRIFLRYGPDGQSAIASLDRVSKPGHRVYVGAREIPRVLGGLGVSILTTPRGVMTGKSARKVGVGGEILCSIT